MARKRMIDPSIWTDEGMAELEPRQQLLYIGLISNADDDGRIKGSPAAIALMLPTLYSTRDRGIIEEDLENVLSCMTQLVRYEVDGRPYLAFKNYRQWQKIDRPSDSHLPPPPKETPKKSTKSPSVQAENQFGSKNDPGSLDDDSSNDQRAIDPNRIEKNGKEKNDDADESAPSQDTPFALLESLCEVQGQDVSVLTGREKSKQLAVAKRLIGDGLTAADVTAITKWLTSQSWITGGIDLFLVEKQAGKWRLAGKPTSAPQRGTPTVHQGGSDDEIDPRIIGPERMKLVREKWMRDNPEKAAQFIRENPQRARELGMTG